MWLSAMSPVTETELGMCSSSVSSAIYMVLELTDYRYIDLKTKEEVDRVLENMKDTTIRDTPVTLEANVSVLGTD